MWRQKSELYSTFLLGIVIFVDAVAHIKGILFSQY